MTLSSLSNFITTRLGRMKAWAACDSLDWVTCLPLHFTLAYIVYRESRTHKVVYIHLHYGISDEMYIGIDNRFGYQTRSTNILSPERAAVHRVFPRDSTRGLGIAQMSEQFSWSRHWADCLLNATTESECLSALMKNRRVRGVWTVLYNCIFSPSGWHRQLNIKIGAAPPFYVLLQILHREANDVEKQIHLVSELSNEDQHDPCSPAFWCVGCVYRRWPNNLWFTEESVSPIGPLSS